MHPGHNDRQSWISLGLILCHDCGAVHVRHEAGAGAVLDLEHPPSVRVDHYDVGPLYSWIDLLDEMREQLHADVDEFWVAVSASQPVRRHPSTGVDL